MDNLDMKAFQEKKCTWSLLKNGTKDPHNHYPK